MRPPYFSVVIPFYNARATIGRAVASCLDQTFRDFELILVDDGSFDDYKTVLEDCLSDQSDLISLIKLQKNSGPSIARNMAIMHARGCYIAFLDADDVWHPRKLEIMMDVIEKYPGYRMYFHDAVVASNLVQTVFPLYVQRISFWRFLLKNYSYTPCVIVPNNSSVRFSEALRHSEDYDLWLKMVFPQGALRLKQPLACLGRPVGSTGGLSSHRNLMRWGEMRTYMRLYRLSPALQLLAPLLVFWSFAKFLRSIVLNAFKR